MQLRYVRSSCKQNCRRSFSRRKCSWHFEANTALDAVSTGSVPPYTDPAFTQSSVMCAGLNFRDPTGRLPSHSDDVRLRMLGRVLRNSKVRSVGTGQSDKFHIASDIRSPRGMWLDQAQECEVLCLTGTF
jgi:hypothetical protein